METFALHGNERRSAITVGPYRYSLTRVWAPDDGSRACWIMLNPSTADAVEDDPTIRRCRKFSAAQAGGMEIVNLFGWRATSPLDLIDAQNAGEDVVGPRNAWHVDQAIRRADYVVAAWGAHGGGFADSTSFLQGFRDYRKPLYCLGLTNNHSPRHPLYVRGDTPMRRYPVE